MLFSAVDICMPYTTCDWLSSMYMWKHVGTIPDAQLIEDIGLALAVHHRSGEPWCT